MIDESSSSPDSKELAVNTPQTNGRYGWARWGDINAFFGLMLDNLAVMVMLTSLLTSSEPLRHQKPGQYRFTHEFVLTRMIPGTALGVLLGDLIYTWMAFRLARRSGRSDVTAMPLGLDTPSTFAIPFFVILPVLEEYIKNQEGPITEQSHGEAMRFAWHVGLMVLVLIGIFKVAFAPLGNAVRRWVPRAGLLGSLAAIALALIACLPLLEYISTVPLVGMLALTVILVTLVAHRRLPGNFPGALAAVLIGVVAYVVFDEVGKWTGWPLVPPLVHERGSIVQLPHLMPFIEDGQAGWDWWVKVFEAALTKLPIAMPFALATIVGGIDCTESAAAAGDDYDTRTILLTEGIASVVAGLLGGVLQTTPYIGQPAYKKMGGRAAYTLATALFIGAVGVFGWFGLLFDWLPKPVMFPILVFVGLEITAQSFHATPTRHYPALALAALPALAALVLIVIENGFAGQKPAERAVEMMQSLRCLKNGFIITSLLWGASLAAMLDGHLRRSGIYLLVAAVCAFFGIIHSPLPDAPIALPWHVLAELEPSSGVLVQSPYHWTGAYILAAGVLFGLSLFAIPDERRGVSPP